MTLCEKAHDDTRKVLFSTKSRCESCSFTGTCACRRVIPILFLNSCNFLLYALSVDQKSFWYLKLTSGVLFDFMHMCVKSKVCLGSEGCTSASEPGSRVSEFAAVLQELLTCQSDQDKTWPGTCNVSSLYWGCTASACTVNTAIGMHMYACTHTRTHSQTAVHSYYIHVQVHTRHKEQLVFLHFRQTTKTTQQL